MEQEHLRQFALLLGAIHCGGFRNRASFAELFGDRSCFQALRLEPYFACSATQVPGAAAFLGSLIEETNRTVLTLVHGDYSPKNALIHDDRLVLLDHEVIHFGDPAFDVGFSLTHFLSKAHHLPAFRERFGETALLYWSVYCDAIAAMPWTDDLEPRAVRHALGCLLARVAGRSQLEYLGPQERECQRDVVVEFMAAPPARIGELVEQFLSRIAAREHAAAR